MQTMGNDVRVERREDGVYLVAEPNASLSVPSVVFLLKTENIPDYDGDAVASFVNGHGAKSVKVAERAEGQETDKAAEIDVQIGTDKLTADIWIEPPFGNAPWPTEEDVVRKLQEKGVIHGLLQDAIRDLLKKRDSRQWIRIAQGTPAVDGVDSEVEYKIAFGSSKPKEVEDGQNVDFRDTSSVTSILKNQLLATRTPATEGREGMNVLGAPIRAKNGRERTIPSGSGVRISETGNELYADIDGHLVLKNGKLNVLPIFQVDEDLDFSVGNIEFVGAVLVRGSVREGFSIVSSGDVEVNGVVEGAKIQSGGNILIHGGIRGMSKAHISAEGDVSAGFIDQANVRAKKNLNVKNAVLHSDVGAHGSVIVVGGSKAQIAGGKVQAGSEVICLNLGSEMGTRTEVTVGVLPEYVERRKELLAALDADEVNHKKIETNIQYLKKLEATGQLDETKRGILISLMKANFQLQSKLKTEQNEFRELEELVEKSKTQGAVRVKGVCYPGVTVSMRGLTYIVREEQKFCSFVYDGGEIKVKPYDY